MILLNAPVRLAAQERVIPYQDWRTVQSAHFVMHFPAQLEAWSMHLAARLESLHQSVVRLVGFTPAERITVIVDDPYAQSNGFALPGPVIYLWPSPPAPRVFTPGEFEWPELLAAHELAHVAHLSRPSRNPRENLLWRLLPTRLGPMYARQPRWIMEAYATWVEGKVSGGGRPYGAWQPSVLRQFALEGTLPRYSQLNATGGFYGGAMAYLAGSAFLEWLVQREGEESLVNLWRRLSARTPRTFESAFAGVYGASPSELYSRFTAELTSDALAVERAVQGAGAAEGELFQYRTWYTGDPAVSRDGRHLAVTLRSETDPTRMVVWDTGPDTLSQRLRDRADSMVRLDTGDVPAVRRRPSPRKAVAELVAPPGGSVESPRFSADGDVIYLTRRETSGDGRRRSDLFEWQWRSGLLRRMTHGAGVQDPDPEPRSRWLVATRCETGWCDVVKVSAADGAVSVLAPGSPERSYYRPRVSPAGDVIVASVNDNGTWRVVLLDTTGVLLRRVGPADNVSRFDADFSADGRSVVVVADEGGIYNLQQLQLSDGQVSRLTNVRGAALSPTVAGDGTVYFLSLHARGYNVQRVSTGSGSTGGTVPGLEDNLALPSSDRRGGAPIGVQTGLQRSAYNVGAQRLFWLPVGSVDGSGGSAGLMLASSDPVGLLSLNAIGLIGDGNAWSGGRLSGVWRGMRTELSISGTLARAGWEQRAVADGIAAPHDERIHTMDLGFRFTNERTRGYDVFLAGGTLGRIQLDGNEWLWRRALTAEGSVAREQRAGSLRVGESVLLRGAAGSTADADWTRVDARLRAGVLTGNSGLIAALHWSEFAGDGSPADEIVIGAAHELLLSDWSFGGRKLSPALVERLDSGRRWTMLRLQLQSGALLSPYWERHWLGGGIGGRFDVTGLEVDAGSDRVPYLATPAVRARIGAALVGAPGRPDYWRGYITLAIAP